MLKSFLRLFLFMLLLSRQHTLQSLFRINGWSTPIVVFWGGAFWVSFYCFGALVGFCLFCFCCLCLVVAICFSFLLVLEDLGEGALRATSPHLILPFYFLVVFICLL